MLSSLRNHFSSSRVSHVADWSVLVLGAILLTTAIVGTVITPAQSIQAQVEFEAARENAALF